MPKTFLLRWSLVRPSRMPPAMPTAPVTAGTPIRATALRPALFAPAPPVPDSPEALVLLPLPSLWLARLARSRALPRPELDCRLVLFRALLRPLDPLLARDPLLWLPCERDPLLRERDPLLLLRDRVPELSLCARALLPPDVLSP